MITRARVKFKHWSRTHHLMRDGKTLCGKKPTEVETLPGPAEPGKTCSSCKGSNNGRETAIVDRYPIKSWGDVE